MPGGRPATKYFTEQERREAAVNRAKKWREDNRERYEKTEKIRRIKSKDKIVQNRKKWTLKNKEKINKARRLRAVKRRLEDPVFRFKEITKKLIYNSFTRRQKYKKSRTEHLLGCSMEFFQNYILSKCPETIGLKDFGVRGYHIDHIIPISSAKTEKDVIKLCHYTNFQPLFWRDNILKSNKII